jgi:hypothetical protein
MNRLCVRETDRLYVKWFCADSAAWRQILGNFRACFRTHGQAIYSGRERAWSLPLCQRRRLQTWADCWFALDEQHWDGDEEEPARRSRHPGTKPQALSDAYAALHLLPSAPTWAAEAVYRAALKRVHPDVGGDHASAVRLVRAMETIKEHEERSA